MKEGTRVKIKPAVAHHWGCEKNRNGTIIGPDPRSLNSNVFDVHLDETGRKVGIHKQNMEEI